MTLQLSGRSEKLPELHREFYGQVRVQMPLLVSESSPHSNSLLNVYFNQTTKDRRPTMRSWVVDRVADDSRANGGSLLYYDYGRLVGVAPEAHVGARKALEARVWDAARHGREFELCGHLYVPVDASVAARLRK